MREKQRGPDILAKTSRSYQINMFLIIRNAIANGTSTNPILTAYMNMAATADTPAMSNPSSIPTTITVPIIIANAVIIIVVPPYKNYLSI